MQTQSRNNPELVTLYRAGMVQSGPSLRIRDPHRDGKIDAIREALGACCMEHPVCYEDEVDP